MSFQRTTAINKILSLKKRIKGVQGGTSAGKTYGILPIEIDFAIKEKVHTSVVSESLPHLKRGAIKDFKEIMLETGRWRDSCWHQTDSRYTFDHNKSTIEFFGADDAAKLRGGRRDRLYINEANNVKFEAFNELAVRTKGSVTLDWNPTSSFWFHDEIKNDDDVDFLIINYQDNEACPQSAIDYILKAKEKAKTSSYWQNWYNVYGLGLIGSLEGVIFNNWKQIQKIPFDAKLISHGLDFGYTNDPTALVSVYMWNGKLILDEKIYQTGLLNSDIKKQINNFGITNEKPIFADSAEPKSIDELKLAGIWVKPALKGADSIKFGIDYLQQYELLVTSNSVNLIKELRNYQWEKDKQGKTLNKPIDAYNHCIDAVRYAVCELSIPRQKLIFA